MITPPVTIITHGIVAVAAAAGAWAWQANSYEAKLAAVQTEYAQAQARAVEHAHADTIRLQEKADHAQANAAVRIRTASADRDLLRAAVDRLRGELAKSPSGSNADTGAAADNNGSAAAVVSAECADALATMAGHADGWRSEAMTLREAWPTNKEEK